MRTRLLAITLLVAAGLPAQQGAVRATAARVAVDVVDGVATVELELKLHNASPRLGEADWLLPLPEGAVADGFVTRIGDAAPIEGEVLDAGRARDIYEAIVRRRRDPGLLEYAGRGCLRARLFPIPANGDAEVRVRWRQVLPELNGLVRWALPLAATGIDGVAPDRVSFAVKVRSSAPIRTALSPTPDTDVQLVDERHVVASFEPPPGQPLPKELALYYGLSEEAFGLHLLAQRATDSADGHFALLISPKRDWDDAEIPPRIMTFVLDVSGSMKGRKIEQAKGALRQFLRGLRPIDRFDVVPFSTDAAPFFGEPVEASEQNVANALQRVDGIEARGGTNLEQAIARGLPANGNDPHAVPMCVLLSDGLPTVGETDPTRLRERARGLVSDRNIRVFVLGVGDDVHTVLLDDLVEVGRGVRQYVRPDEDIEDKASDLLTKIGKPVMTDLRLKIDGADASRISPTQLPDLFAGSRLVVTGRFAKPGAHQVRLSGRVGEVEREYVYDAVFPADETANDFVPKLWATRRVAALLDEIRRNGAHPELLDEVRTLGVEFQIVTPYTAHLVVEDALGVQVPTRPTGTRPWPGSGGGGGRTPGPAGPSTPGLAGPGTGGPAGPTTGGGNVARGHGGEYRGPGDAVPPGQDGSNAVELDLAALGESLRAAGVLPKDAKPAELQRLTVQIAREMQQSAQGLTGLGKNASGQTAVDDSVYLARLVGQTGSDGSDAFFMGSGRRGLEAGRRPLHELFVRKVGDKVFQLRDGVWTDRSFDAKTDYATSTKVVAFSDEYFALLRSRPSLTRYVALSDRMKLVDGDDLIEIVPAPTEPAAPAPATTPRKDG